MKERRLAAIMFTDIVGYTALMGLDEDRAFKILHTNREIHIKLIEQFEGKLIKEMGDGMLISFHLAADAVHCAIEIQKRARAELDAQVRIGIHLGDITFKNEDVFGDGVNIASRVQSIADPGGIYISENVQNSIRSKTDIPTRYLGEFTLKNVSYKLKIYSVTGNGLTEPSDSKINQLKGQSHRTRLLKSLPIYILLISIMVVVWWTRKQPINENLNISSLMVLPFDNFTGSDTLEYFVAGMHSSLIGDIGKISSIQVKSKTTSRAYKDTNKSIPEIASEQNVDAIVEASVLCLGDTICFQVKVLSAFPEEKLLWDQDYYIEKSQILNLYNLVTKDISDKINIILSPEEEKLLADAKKVDEDAYDAYLRGQIYWESLSKEGLEMATHYFNIAVEKDPDWEAPYAGLAMTWGGRMQMGFISPDIAIPKIYENLNKALELDPNSTYSHYANALMAVWTEWDWEKGEKEFLRTIELNPNDALAHMYYAHLLISLGRTQEAMTQAELALQLDPLRPLVMALYGVTKLSAGEYQTAYVQARKAVEIEPESFFANMILEYASYFMKDYEQSLDILTKFLPIEEQGLLASKEAFIKQGYNAAMIVRTESLVNSGYAEYYPPSEIGLYYMRIGDIDNALEWYEKAYETHDPNIPYIRTELYHFHKLDDNPRYHELLKKMNLPLP